MAKKLYTESSISAIADAIRSKNRTQETYTVSQMAGAIDNIVSADLGTKTVTANGTYAASSDNLDGYSSVTVSIPSFNGVEF